MTERGLKYLSDILYSINLISDFIKPVSNFQDYIEDLKTQSAVERQLGIIGEAVSKFDKLHPELGLENAKKIVGFRNRLIHAYDLVDPSIIWVIIQNHLDSLKEEVLKKMDEC